MNILHVNMSLDPVTGGGTVERIRQLYLAMQGVSGVHSRVLSLAVGDSPVLTESNDVVLLPCWNRRWYLPALKLLTMVNLVQWADVIHLMNHWTILNAMVYWLARMTGTPDIVCPAGALPLFGRSQGFKRGYNRLVGTNLVNHCAAAICVAEEEREALQQYGVGAERIFHVPNGVRQEDFSCADTRPFRQNSGLGDAEYLLFVGRLNAIKGPDLLLDAFIAISGDFPQLHLVFIGPNGGMLDDLRCRGEKAALTSRLHFVGYAGGDTKSAAYHGASMLVVPSRQEAMSIVALEAAICSVPVVLTDRCGFDALAQAGGAMLAEASSEALAEAIGTLLRCPELRRKMGGKGREFALADYTWDIAAGSYVEIFERLLRRP
ncbi:MAG: glycosyltransferase family 4 protein [Mariprofundales bacterium]